MATPGGARLDPFLALSASRAHGHREADDDGAAFSSSSSYRPEMHRRLCPWRNEQFHEQECSRYFDCPSHTIARAIDGDHQAAHHVEPDPAEDATAPRHDILLDHGEEQSGSFAGDQSRSHLVDLDNDDDVAINLNMQSGSDVGAAEIDTQPSSQGMMTAEDPVLLDSPTLRMHPSHGFEATFSSATVFPPAPRVLFESRRGSADVPLPRWQSDNEVTYCPICKAQFSIFVRKHHCRKCGRVVCGSCSPHRITIPYQYIVQQPGAPQHATQPHQHSRVGGGAGGHADLSSSLGGGEKVRLCNPCVPDPNITPPHIPLQMQPPPRISVRSQSNPDQMPRSGSSTWSSAVAGTSHSDIPTDRASRSSTSQAGDSSSHRAASPYSYLPHNRPGYPGYQSYQSPRHQPYPGSAQGRHRSTSDRLGGPSSLSLPLSSTLNRQLPPTPRSTRHAIAEEDECPICHLELPPRATPNSESLREQHINGCIIAHSSYGSRIASPAPSSWVGSPAVAPPAVSPSPAARAPPRRSGMFPYAATEKDCVDSAECTICLEEFEVGVPMARLECLCRFHKRCIDAWWERNPGRCPMHQHDEAGF